MIKVRRSAVLIQIKKFFPGNKFRAQFHARKFQKAALLKGEELEKELCEH